MKKDILLVCWLILFPLVRDIGNYIKCATRKMEGKDPFNNNVHALQQAIDIIILFTVAISIYSEA